MAGRRAFFRMLTEGEGCVALSYAMVAGFSAGIGFVTVSRLDPAAVFSRSLTAYEVWIILCATMGGAVALYMAGDRVGQRGLAGHLKGALSVIWISTVGAIIAGTLALPVYGTMFGPLLLAGTLASQKVLATLWASNLMAAHVLIGVWRQERETLLQQPVVYTGIRHGRFAA